MIEVKDLTKSYGDRLAIDRLSFSVKRGEIVGFLGPNGAGKTTTMKIITGFMAPTSGKVEIAGYDVFENPMEVKKRIGYLPETPPVYLDMYVTDYLAYVARLKGVARSQVKSQVDLVLQKCNLGEVRNRLIQNLSKGYRQRCGLAQALVNDPEILILDEPTVGLDPRQVAEIRHLIQQLRGQHTVILSTHILPEVQATCERIIIINRGQIVATDSIEGLSRRFSGARRVVIKVRRGVDKLATSLGAISGIRAVRKGAGLLEMDTDDREETVEAIADHVVAQGAGLMELKTLDLGLEDVFIKLTSNEEAQTSVNSKKAEVTA